MINRKFPAAKRDFSPIKIIIDGVMFSTSTVIKTGRISGLHT